MSFVPSKESYAGVTDDVLAKIRAYEAEAAALAARVTATATAPVKQAQAAVASAQQAASTALTTAQATAKTAQDTAQKLSDAAAAFRTWAPRIAFGVAVLGGLVVWAMSRRRRRNPDDSFYRLAMDDVDESIGASREGWAEFRRARGAREKAGVFGRSGVRSLERATVGQARKLPRFLRLIGGAAF